MSKVILYAKAGSWNGDKLLGLIKAEALSVALRLAWSNLLSLTTYVFWDGHIFVEIHKSLPRTAIDCMNVIGHTLLPG